MCFSLFSFTVSSDDNDDRVFILFYRDGDADRRIAFSKKIIHGYQQQIKKGKIVTKTTSANKEY